MLGRRKSLSHLSLQANHTFGRHAALSLHGHFRMDDGGRRLGCRGFRRRWSLKHRGEFKRFPLKRRRMGKTMPQNHKQRLREPTTRIPAQCEIVCASSSCGAICSPLVPALRPQKAAGRRRHNFKVGVWSLHLHAACFSPPTPTPLYLLIPRRTPINCDTLFTQDLQVLSQRNG